MRKKKSTIITQEQKDNITRIQVTLDGQPAMVNGRLMPYPIVRTQDMSKSYSFTWEAVQRIVSKGGEFKSGD